MLTTHLHPSYQGSWGQHGARLGPTGTRWAPCWPHELCYLRCPVWGIYNQIGNVGLWQFIPIINPIDIGSYIKYIRINVSSSGKVSYHRAVRSHKRHAAANNRQLICVYRSVFRLIAKHRYWPFERWNPRTHLQKGQWYGYSFPVTVRVLIGCIIFIYI